MELTTDISYTREESAKFALEQQQKLMAASAKSTEFVQ